MDLLDLKKAKAIIKGSSSYPDIHGFVYFMQTAEGVMVTADIYGLPQFKNKSSGRFFGFHIHGGTSCTGNKQDPFADAKTHLNPINSDHPYHLGDLPPLIEHNGHAYMSVLIGKFDIDDILGKTIIIHEMPDDFTTQPGGNAGAKIACGVIKK